MSVHTGKLGISTRWGLNLLAAVAVVAALYFGSEIFIPFVFAALLASVLWPTADWLHRKLRFGWTFSCLFVVGAFVAFSLFITTNLAISIPKIIQDIPNLRDPDGQKRTYEMVRKRVELLAYLSEKDEFFPLQPDDSRVFNYLQTTLAEGQTLTHALWVIVGYTNSWLWHFVLVVFITVFMLMEGKMLARGLTEIFSDTGMSREQAKETLSAMAFEVRKYLIWRTLVNIVLGLAVAVAYRWIFHLKHPWTWGVLTMVASYVPYLGPLFAGIPPFVDSFMSSPTPWYAVGLLGFYTLIITLEGYVIYPLVIGRRAELNATTVMLACLFWEAVWGLPGLFLAVPLMAAVKAICNEVPGWKPWANLMGVREDVPV
ncbi:AI-2E family transporter [soil metagenome]